MSEGRITRDDLNPNVLASLRGPQGEPGQQGAPGIPGEQGLPGNDAEVTSENIERALGFLPTELQIATESTLGGIKPDGETITVDPETGVASAVGGGGDSTKSYTGDLNNLTTTGLYFGDKVIGTENLPTNNLRWLINVISFEDATAQIAYYAQDHHVAGSPYRREKINGIWGDWFRITPALNNTLTSTSTTEAATANAVKQVNDKFLNLNVSDWVTLTLGTGWTNETTSRFAAVRKNNHLVEVRFSLMAWAGHSSTILTLPVGYRPAMRVPVVCDIGLSTVLVGTLLPNGTVALGTNDSQAGKQVSANIIFSI